MTYAQLFEVLKTMNKVSKEKMADHVVFVDVYGENHRVSHTEYNDGSIKGSDPFQLLLLEV